MSRYRRSSGEEGIVYIITLIIFFVAAFPCYTASEELLANFVVSDNSWYILHWPLWVGLTAAVTALLGTFSVLILGAIRSLFS